MIRGIEMALHENEALSNHIRREQDFFEAEILDYLRDNHYYQRVIVDVGANIGNHAVYFANFLSYESILCFEPILENYSILSDNMSGYSNIGLVNAAASASTHNDLHMFMDTENMGASRVHLDGNISVKAMSIDKAGLQNVTLLKMDVEGHEPSVIEGAKDTIFRCHPLILIEDWERKYATLLPNYELEKGWEEHQTFLYRWKDD